MSLKGIIISLITCAMCSPCSYAGTMGGDTTAFKYVGTLWGGLANITVQSEHKRRFISTDDDQFIYRSKNNSKNAGVVGVFLGAEHSLPHPGLFMQAGVEYADFANARARGLNWVGIEPATFTFYRYHFNVHSQQMLAVAKLFTTTSLPSTTHLLLYPYISVGLGASFNNASEYVAATPELGSVNLTPVFHGKTNTAFTYNLGVGFDTPITQQLRFGLGYQFCSLGSARLGHGNIVMNQYVYPVSFSLHSPHVYANQLIVRMSYLV